MISFSSKNLFSFSLTTFFFLFSKIGMLHAQEDNSCWIQYQSGYEQDVFDTGKKIIDKVNKDLGNVVFVSGRNQPTVKSDDCRAMVWLVRRGLFGKSRVIPNFVKVSDPLLVMLDEMDNQHELAWQCSVLENVFIQNDVLRVSDRSIYCDCGCSFARIDCTVMPSSIGVGFIDIDYNKFIRLFVDDVIDKWEAKEAEYRFLNEDVVEIMREIGPNLLRILTSIIPISFNYHKKDHWWLTPMIFVYGIANIWLCGGDYSILAHNGIISVFSAYMPSGTAQLYNTIPGIVPLVCIYFGCFFTSLEIQILVFFGGIGAYISYLYYAFFVKRAGPNEGLIVMLFQVFVMYSQLDMATHKFALRSFGALVLHMLLNTIVPRGPTSSYLLSAAILARRTAIKALWIEKYSGFVLFFILQLFGFLLSRMCFGAFTIVQLRYKFNFRTMFIGLWIYMADAFGPLNYARRWLFGLERSNIRRTMYAVAGGILLASEMFYARYFFILRVSISFLDSTIIHSVYGKMTHQLAYNVDYGQSVFPQVGAAAWFDGNKLMSIMNATQNLIACRNGKYVKGVGFLMRGGKKKFLYTVAHVIKGTNRLQFGDFDYSYGDKDWDEFSGPDPVVSSEVSTDEHGADVEILTSAELDSVQSLCTVIPDEDGEACVNITDKFKFEGSILKAQINLRKGDSGGPVFALLKNTGDVRFAGVVSRGNMNRGGGNYISTVLAKNLNTEDEGYSTEDASVYSTEHESANNPVARELSKIGGMVKQVVKAIDIAGFNKQRGVVDGNSQVDDRVRKVLAADPVDVKKFNYAIYNYCSDDKLRFDSRVLPKYEELKGIMSEGDFDALVEKHDAELQKLSDLPGSDNEGDHDDASSSRGKEEEEERRRKKKKDKKARNKDKAVRKRAYMYLNYICHLADDVYSDDFPEVVFNQLVKGKVSFGLNNHGDSVLFKHGRYISKKVPEGIYHISPIV